MKKIIIILVLMIGVKAYSQFIFKTTKDTVYFMTYHNDSVKLEPLAIPPNAMLVSNFDALGYAHYIADSKETCETFILNMSLKDSELSADVLIIDSQSKTLYANIKGEGTDKAYTINAGQSLVTNITALNGDGFNYKLYLSDNLQTLNNISE